MSESKLQNLFPSIKIIVRPKADSLFPVVSAASICEKVLRDFHLKFWKFPETSQDLSIDFGSGYPGDPKTKAWLRSNLDPVFGFPSVIRFSWKTTQKLIF